MMGGEVVSKRALANLPPAILVLKVPFSAVFYKGLESSANGQMPLPLQAVMITDPALACQVLNSPAFDKFPFLYSFLGPVSPRQDMPSLHFLNPPLIKVECTKNGFSAQSRQDLHGSSSSGFVAGINQTEVLECCSFGLKRKTAVSQLLVQLLGGPNMLSSATDSHWRGIRKSVAPAFSTVQMRWTVCTSKMTCLGVIKDSCWPLMHFCMRSK